MICNLCKNPILILNHGVIDGGVVKHSRCYGEQRRWLKQPDGSHVPACAADGCRGCDLCLGERLPPRTGPRY